MRIWCRYIADSLRLDIGKTSRKGHHNNGLIGGGIFEFQLPGAAVDISLIKHNAIGYTRRTRHIMTCHRVGRHIMTVMLARV
ncbi:MAG TPA: hypothetical protein PKH39_09710 [Woeseiaceae bacterium]|nr:hypothetical protein [Woeseiaceae bacterium]